MIRKLIFLDVDGVLNQVRTPRRIHFDDGSEDTTGQSQHVGCDDACTAQLARLVLETGASVVLSSSHRNHHLWLGRMQRMLRAAGFPKEQLRGLTIDRTPRLSGATRGDEIQAWLSTNPSVRETRIVIFDDDTDMGPLLLPHLVRTYLHDGGLTADHVDSAIRMLNGAAR